MIKIDDTLFAREHIAQQASRFAAEAGIAGNPHARYAVCFQQMADWLAAFFAIRAAGASVLPIHPATPHAAARRLAETAGCHVLFHNSLVPEPLPASPPDPGEGQLLQMSSGTTGAPKCVARAWSDIKCEVETYAATFTAPDGMTPVIACPTTHSYGLICGIIVALERGLTPVIVNTANPKYLLKVMAEAHNPLLYSSPALLYTLARLVPEGERLHAVMTSGTLLPQPWFATIRGKAHHMFQQYGCSEAGCIAVNADVAAADEMGHVLSHLVAQAGSSVQTPGEIVVAGVRGAVHTRDFGYLREDGMLVFVSRMDDTINVSGLNVYPKEVEDVAMAMPEVTDAVAFRMADRFAGERVGLLYSADRPLAGREVRAWCSARLAAHQVPMELIPVEDVPRQANGKISRREVAELYANGGLRRVPEPA